MYQWYNLISDYSNNAKCGHFPHLLGRAFQNVGPQSRWQ